MNTNPTATLQYLVEILSMKSGGYFNSKGSFGHSWSAFLYHPLPQLLSKMRDEQIVHNLFTWFHKVTTLLLVLGQLNKQMAECSTSSKVNRPGGPQYKEVEL